MPENEKENRVEDVTYLGNISFSQHQLLIAFKKELLKKDYSGGLSFFAPDEKPPLVITVDKKHLKAFIRDLIKDGTELDLFFSYASASEWSYNIVEDLIDCYWFWMRGVAALVNSQYGTSEELRLKYPALTDPGGVSGILATMLNPIRWIKEDGKDIGLHEGPRIMNMVPRLGERNSRHPESGYFSDREGINQCENAHTSVKRKIQALWEIIKNDFSKEEKGAPGFYIIKVGDDYKYGGRILVDVSKDTDYYTVFDALYTFLPEGGIVTYADLGKEVGRRIKKVIRLSKTNLTRFLQRNLTDNKNGFLYYAKISNTIPGGKKLIRANRGKKGIEFNNRRGG